jgi:hypothetical protein
MAGDVNTGKPHTGMDAPTHVKGIKQGNSVGNYAKQAGHKPDGSSTARRSTGVHPGAQEPIDPSMPNLSTARLRARSPSSSSR